MSPFPADSSSKKDLASLKARWTSLYKTTLPHLARSKAPSQPIWPVNLDHCFARIILDTVIGNSAHSAGDSSPAPWTQRLQSPAINHMKATQLEECIALGEAIAQGSVNLEQLDEQSLSVRGKRKPKAQVGGGSSRSSTGKRKLDTNPTIITKAKPSSSEQESHPQKKKKKQQKTSQASIRTLMGLPSPPSPTPLKTPENHTDMPPASSIPPSTLNKITSHLTMTPYRKKILTALCQIPKGQYTTYLALSNHFASSPRAVGNALAHNPFAPEVPCHRVVASNGGIGGFCGEWGVTGKHNAEKVRLLREEGVVVEKDNGKVSGKVWTGFR